MPPRRVFSYASFCFCITLFAPVPDKPASPPYASTSTPRHIGPHSVQARRIRIIKKTRARNGLEQPEISEQSRSFILREKKVY